LQHIAAGGIGKQRVGVGIEEEVIERIQKPVVPIVRHSQAAIKRDTGNPCLAAMVQNIDLPDRARPVGSLGKYRTQ